MRYGDIGVCGNRAHRTAAIDQLAHDGITFTNCHAPGDRPNDLYAQAIAVQFNVAKQGFADNPRGWRPIPGE